MEVKGGSMEASTDNNKQNTNFNNKVNEDVYKKLEALNKEYREKYEATLKEIGGFLLSHKELGVIDYDIDYLDEKGMKQKWSILWTRTYEDFLQVVNHHIPVLAQRQKEQEEFNARLRSGDRSFIN